MSAHIQGRIRKDGKVMVVFNYPMSGRTIRKLIPFKEAQAAVDEHNAKPGPTAQEIRRAAHGGFRD